MSPAEAVNLVGTVAEALGSVATRRVTDLTAGAETYFAAAGAGGGAGFVREPLRHVKPFYRIQDLGLYPSELLEDVWGRGKAVRAVTRAEFDAMQKAVADVASGAVLAHHVWFIDTNAIAIGNLIEGRRTSQAYPFQGRDDDVLIESAGQLTVYLRSRLLNV